MRSNLYKSFKSGLINKNEYDKQNIEIGCKYFSDKRITAVTSGPAKKLINYLLKYMKI